MNHTEEQLEAYALLSKIRNGFFNIQAHPGTGKTSFVVSGILDNMFKFR